MRKASTGAIRNIALIVSLLTLLLSLPLFSRFDVSNPRMQFEQSGQGIPSLGVQYHVGIDGISLFLVLLTTVLTPIALATSRFCRCPVFPLHDGGLGAHAGGHHCVVFFEWCHYL